MRPSKSGVIRQVTQQHQTAIVATYVQALSEMIGISEKRLAAFENRVLEALWIIFVSRDFPNLKPDTA
jgi:hypothetical protein